MSKHRFQASIIIPLFNQAAYTHACLLALADNTPDELYEVVLVDNGSTDETSELLEALGGDVQVLKNPQNLGFSRACNQGAAAATGRHLVFLNNDVEPHAGWLEPLLELADREPDIGAIGSRLLFPDGTLQHAGVIVLQDLMHGAHALPVHASYRKPADHPPATVRRDMTAVTGACMLVRREAFAGAGGFDEGYWNGYEDVALCFSLGELGWRVVYEPASVLTHHESVSGPERFARVNENMVRLETQWGNGRVIPEGVRDADGTCTLRALTATFPNRAAA